MYHAKFILKHAERDYFETGCDPDDSATSEVNIECKGITLDALIDDVTSVFGVSRESMLFNACDETGRLDVQRYEGNDGAGLDKALHDPETAPGKAWRAGTLKVWLCTYTATVTVEQAIDLQAIGDETEGDISKDEGLTPDDLPRVEKYFLHALDQGLLQFRVSPIHPTWFSVEVAVPTKDDKPRDQQEWDWKLVCNQDMSEFKTPIQLVEHITAHLADRLRGSTMDVNHLLRTPQAAVKRDLATLDKARTQAVAISERLKMPVTPSQQEPINEVVKELIENLDTAYVGFAARRTLSN
jgi:hypothetical protein